MRVGLGTGVRVDVDVTVGLTLVMIVGVAVYVTTPNGGVGDVATRRGVAVLVGSAGVGLQALSPNRITAAIRLGVNHAPVIFLPTLASCLKAEYRFMVLYLLVEARVKWAND